MATQVPSVDLPLQGKIVEDAMRKAGRAARLLHKQTGHPIIVWKDGKVVEMPPEEIVLDDEE